MRIKKQGQHLLITIDEEYENRPYLICGQTCIYHAKQFIY